MTIARGLREDLVKRDKGQLPGMYDRIRMAAGSWLEVYAVAIAIHGDVSPQIIAIIPGRMTHRSPELSPHRLILSF